MLNAYLPPRTKCNCPSCRRALDAKFDSITKDVLTREDAERIAKEAFRDFPRKNVINLMNG